MLNDIWRFRLLGTLEAQQGNVTTDRFRTRKTAALLAYLAFYPHTAHSREELATLLWPDATPELGLKSLGVALSSIRKLLEPPRVPVGTVLIADRRTARFRPEAIQTDVAGFQQALKAASAARDVQERRIHLEAAIALYRGDLLPGFLEEWIVPERDLLVFAYRRALDEVTGILEASGQLDEALACALKHAAADSYDEKSHARLMRLYVAAGQPAEALRRYRNLEQRLYEDLGERPSEQTRELARQLPTAPDKEPRLPAEFQLAVSHAVRSPSAQSEERIRLPLFLTAFFGREHEIESLQKLLQGRLVTLTGPGGSGKTRLAVESARRFAAEFRGRVLFVPLADLTSSQEIPLAVRNVLRLPNLPGAPSQGELTSALSAIPTLLLLDNVEHLLAVNETQESAGVRRLIVHLLEEAPSLRVLTTSRQPLGATGEQEFPVRPLPVPPPEVVSRQDASEDVMHYACMQLFADRARLKQPDFQITVRNINAVAALCRRLDGIPLALELAAGLSRVLPPEAMLMRLSQTQDVLVSRQKDSPDRHKSLYSAIEWSYRLLEPRLQKFLRRLSCFTGRWTAEAAGEVCEEPNALDSLAALEERSLIVAEQRGEVVSYRMLETIREYGSTCLRTLNEDALARRAHAFYFIKLAETHRLKGKMPEVIPEERAALGILEDHYQNISVAFESLLEEPGNRDDAVRLSAVLSRFWLLSRRFEEGSNRLDAILPTARNSADTRSLCEILLHASALAWFRGDYEHMFQLTEELLQTARAHALADLEAAALHGLGVLAGMRGEFMRRDSLLAEAIALWRRLEEPHNLAWSLMSMGWLLVGQGLDREAKPFLEESLSIYSSIGDRLQGGWCQMYLSLILSRSGKSHAGWAMARAALSAFQKEGTASGQLWMLLHMSTIAIALHDLEHAAILLGQVQGLLSRSGIHLPPAELAEYEQNLARIRSSLQEQDTQKALAHGFALSLEQAINYALASHK
jgi:predicted ATPase/DNA-binding SARP family transcriptional activator